MSVPGISRALIGDVVVGNDRGGAWKRPVNYECDTDEK